MRRVLVLSLLAAAASFPTSAAGQVIPEGEWIGDRNDPRTEEHRRRYERLDRQNAREHGTQEQYRSVVRRQGSQDEAHREERHSHGNGGDHRDLHRNYRREHRELHRSDPSRREHREWHRDAQQDHRLEHRDSHRDLHRDYRDEHRDLHRSDPSRREHREWHRDVNRDHRDYHADWDQDWRRDRRYDWRVYRGYNPYVFRAPRYYSPYQGYGYRRYSIGMILDRLFWGSNYRIYDPWQYRLPVAPAGYVWVRYYNDVILVETWSGRVVDVVHNFFW